MIASTAAMPSSQSSAVTQAGRPSSGAVAASGTATSSCWSSGRVEELVVSSDEVEVSVPALASEVSIV